MLYYIIILHLYYIILYFILYFILYYIILYTHITVYYYFIYCIYIYIHERSLQSQVQYFENWLMPLTMVRPQLGVIPCKTGFLTMVTNLQLEFQ